MGIYVFGSSDMDRVKIGFTSRKTAVARRAEVQTGSAYPLEELYWMPSGTMEHERRMHELLRQAGAWAESGEWFMKRHEATSIVMRHAKEGVSAPAKIVKYLEHHVAAYALEGESWRHHYEGHGAKITLCNARKRCSGCVQWLPLTVEVWGAFWRRMADGEMRDQPQCVRCRTVSEHFRDDKTIDMWS